MNLFEATLTITIYDVCLWYATDNVWFLVAAAFMVFSLIVRKKPRKPKPLVIDGQTVRIWDATTGEELFL
jgi:hypothetical protein